MQDKRTDTTTQSGPASTKRLRKEPFGSWAGRGRNRALLGVAIMVLVGAGAFGAVSRRDGSSDVHEGVTRIATAGTRVEGAFDRARFSRLVKLAAANPEFPTAEVNVSSAGTHVYVLLRGGHLTSTQLSDLGARNVLEGTDGWFSAYVGPETVDRIAGCPEIEQAIVPHSVR